MRIIPIEVEVSYLWQTDGNVAELSVLHFDWCDGDAYLFRIGWNTLHDRGFVFDFMFVHYIMQQIFNRWFS